MRDDRVEPSEIGEWVCPTCYQSFLAFFLYLKHARDRHGTRMSSPLSPATNQEGNA